MSLAQEITGQHSQTNGSTFSYNDTTFCWVTNGKTLFFYTSINCLEVFTPFTLYSCQSSLQKTKTSCKFKTIKQNKEKINNRVMESLWPPCCSWLLQIQTKSRFLSRTASMLLTQDNLETQKEPQVCNLLSLPWWSEKDKVRKESENPVFQV